jgi:hypothetical protein
MNFEFFLRPAYSQAIPGVKERAWINENYRLIARTTTQGVTLSLFSRTDKNAEKDLLKEKSYRKRKEFYEIDINLLKQLIKNCDCMHLAVRSKTKRLTDESCRYVLHVYKEKK